MVSMPSRSSNNCWLLTGENVAMFQRINLWNHFQRSMRYCLNKSGPILFCQQIFSTTSCIVWTRCLCKSYSYHQLGGHPYDINEWDRKRLHMDSFRNLSGFISLHDYSSLGFQCIYKIIMNMLGKSLNMGTKHSPMGCILGPK